MGSRSHSTRRSASHARRRCRLTTTAEKRSLTPPLTLRRSDVQVWPAVALRMRPSATRGLEDRLLVAEAVWKHVLHEALECGGAAPSRWPAASRGRRRTAKST